MSCCETTQDGCGVRVVRLGADEVGCCAVPRRFRTAKEKQQELETYRDQLKKELAGVEERIGELERK
jgi:hypothetical protein